MNLQDLNLTPWPEPKNCVGQDPELWFPDRNPKHELEARHHCYTCPAKKQCATEAITTGDHHGIRAAIWLGKDPQWRNKLHTAAGKPKPTPTTPTHCHRDHPLTPDNTKIVTGKTGNPNHICITCRRNAENLRTANKTHCRRGHEWTTQNTGKTKDGRRQCYTCRPPGTGGYQPATHCHKGHELAGNNLHIDVTGKRRCNTCSRPTHCKNGHQHDPTITITPGQRRLCRPCNIAASARYRAKKAAA